MAVWRCAAGGLWRLEIAENEARKGRETYADGLGKAPKNQGSGHLYKHLSLNDLHLILAPFHSGTFPSTPKKLHPSHARIFLRQRRPELRVAVRHEGGPIKGGFQAFAVRGAEPEFDRQAAFANVRMLLERETLVELHLQLR